MIRYETATWYFMQDHINKKKRAVPNYGAAYFFGGELDEAYKKKRLRGNI